VVITGPCFVYEKVWYLCVNFKWDEYDKLHKCCVHFTNIKLKHKQYQLNRTIPVTLGRFLTKTSVYTVHCFMTDIKKEQ